MCRRNYPTDVCNRGTAGNFINKMKSQKSKKVDAHKCIGYTLFSFCNYIDFLLSM